jgi:hypothetical protein
MKKILTRSERGSALVIVVIIGCIFTIIGFSVLGLAGSEKVLTHKALKETRAFHLAEAGVARFVANGYGGDFTDISETALGDGSYWVDVNTDEYPGYAIACGMAGNQQKKIKVEMSFLAPHYEHAIYAGNSGLGGLNWPFALSGEGVPLPVGAWGKVGGKDTINGNLFVNGDAFLYEESSVNPAPLPNTYALAGDVGTTGQASILDLATVSGTVAQGVAPLENPNLVGMNYALNNTHDVSQIFIDAGIGSGYLPPTNELYDVVVKNPGNRVFECASTSGDDYFLEPAGGFIAGSPEAGGTPLDLGENRIYYVDGDVWVHNPGTYGFMIDGKVTIVATGDIHISDNIEYANSDSLLGLVALGQYDGSGNLISGGNIYFGDPRFGTTYTVSALMFAADSFLYNTDAVSRDTGEPQTGFTINGNLNALNQVSILRDWYDPDGGGLARSAYFDPSIGSGEWVDLETGDLLSATEINSIRHYQMIVNYDDRVRNPETQPPGLPRGEGTIFNGVTNWEELPPS